MLSFLCRLFGRCTQEVSSSPTSPLKSDVGGRGEGTSMGPPPAGPVTPPGMRMPDERPPGTRTKGMPEHDLGPVGQPPEV